MFDRSYATVLLVRGGAWCEAARTAGRKFNGLPLEAYCVGSEELRDVDGNFVQAYGITPSGAVLCARMALSLGAGEPL